MQELQALMRQVEPQIQGVYRNLFEEWLKERTPSPMPTEPQAQIHDDGSGIMMSGSVSEIERVHDLRAADAQNKIDGLGCSGGRSFPDGPRSSLGSR
jgi:hypothetical protein